MRTSELHSLVGRASCRVLGWEDASNDSHRSVLGQLIRNCDRPHASLLCEPSLARGAVRPPDIVLVDPLAGVHVIEVKGHTLSDIVAMEAGGLLQFRYGERTVSKSPVAQVRAAMFDIKNAAEQGFDGHLDVPFRYWVVFARISRDQWRERWGADGFCPVEFVFADELDVIVERLLVAGTKYLANRGIEQLPFAELNAIWRAFGDSSVLYAPREDRATRRAQEGTLGETFDEAAESYKTLSDEQQRLSSQNWHEGPRLVRGVAGSGLICYLTGIEHAFMLSLAFI